MKEREKFGGRCRGKVGGTTDGEGAARGPMVSLELRATLRKGLLAIRVCKEVNDKRC